MTTYWQYNSTHPFGSLSKPNNNSIVIIGAGLAGVSTAYFLFKQNYKDIIIIDCGTENASYFRNAGHILHGAGENYKAMCSIHGRSKAKSLFNLSEQFCNQIKNTIDTLDVDCDYHKGEYLVVGSSKQEEQDIIESVEMMNQDGFKTSSIEKDITKWGFKQGVARKCELSAQANPAKFVKTLLEYLIKQGVKYYHRKVINIEELPGSVEITYQKQDSSKHDAAVIATNAYTPLISKYFKDRNLIEPFKGQIIVSSSLSRAWPQMYFSMDHGYIYGTITRDNRLLIGGWRNNVPGGEIGSYDLNINSFTENGLKQFVKENLEFEIKRWDYSWAGIMGSSSTGLPMVGPINNSQIYCLVGCTGYGFGWFHGCGKILADIILGNNISEETYLLSIPKV